MVKTRSSISEEQPKRDVDAWMQGKQFWPASSIAGSKTGRERHMTPADRKETSPAINPEATEEMAKYGITRVPVDYFHYKGYRYTNLDDAIAQAKREHPAINPEATEEMAKYGITRVPVDYFHYEGYRYTNLDDAIAQAKREHPADRSDRRERSGSR